jgi:uncharacterized membrane protein
MFWQKKKRCTCEICQINFPITEMIAIKKIGPSLVPILQQAIPNYDHKGMICRVDLRKLRLQQIETLFDRGNHGSDNLENIFIHEEEHISPYSFNQEYQDELTTGERFSQKITPFIASWGFVVLFIVFIASWVGYNIQGEIKEHFDPFPFTLLNLFLSCMAALQAPIIMMAQNRLSKREQLRADEDYYTNLKAELEIRQLHDKIDKFLKENKN